MRWMRLQFPSSSMTTTFLRQVIQFYIACRVASRTFAHVTKLFLQLTTRRSFEFDRLTSTHSTCRTRQVQSLSQAPRSLWRTRRLRPNLLSSSCLPHSRRPRSGPCGPTPRRLSLRRQLRTPMSIRNSSFHQNDIPYLFLFFPGGILPLLPLERSSPTHKLPVTGVLPGRQVHSYAEQNVQIFFFTHLVCCSHVFVPFLLRAGNRRAVNIRHGY